MSAKRMIGPFELGDRLGVGGMGIVYRAIYTKTGVPCAIKVLSPDLSNETQLQARFEREIAILKKLQHPHIVKYYGGGRFGAQRFYAMELVEGGSLEGLLKKEKQLPWQQVVDYCIQIAKALEHAHAAGVIHRDLKPANLLLTKSGELKLTDFGIARDTSATALTAAGRTVGTYAYMAPEQIRGKPPVDRKTDLYALGCVMFEMLAGETPFSGDQQGEVLMSHLQEEPPRITSLVPSCPQWLEDLIFQMLEKDPNERPFDALQIQTVLETSRAQTEQVTMLQPVVGNGVSEVGATAALPGAKKKKKKKGRQGPTPFYENIYFLVGCLLVLAGVIAWFMRPLSEADLIARATPLMETESVSDWIAARDKYLKPLLERFPEGEHAITAQGYIDKLDVYQAEKRSQIRSMKGQEPEDEGQRLYLEVSGKTKRYEQLGDQRSQLEAYRNMADILSQQSDAAKYRPYLLIARREVARLEAVGAEHADRVQAINKALAKADEHYDADRTLEARSLWSSIATLYGDSRELETQVATAKARLQGKAPEVMEKTE